MNITDLLTITSIDLDAKVSSKEEAIDHFVDLMMATGKINNRELYRKDIFSRESQGSTGVGEGIAIPHAQSEAVDDFALAAMVVKDGVDFVKTFPKSTMGTANMEGIVGKPKVDMLDRMGRRVIVKIKCCDFR